MSESDLCGHVNVRAHNYTCALLYGMLQHADGNVIISPPKDINQFFGVRKE